MSRGYLLGLDGGSSSTKAVIFDTEGNVMGVGRETCRLEHPQAHWVERDMSAAWASATAAIRGALAMAELDGDEILAVGVTGHGTEVLAV